MASSKGFLREGRETIKGTKGDFSYASFGTEPPGVSLHTHNPLSILS